MPISIIANVVKKSRKSGFFKAFSPRSFNYLLNLYEFKTRIDILPFVEEVWEYGSVYEVNKYFSYRYGRVGSKRGKNLKLTSEKQRLINDRLSIKRLRRKIQVNFEEGDLWTTLTYKKDMRPDPVLQKKQFQKFIRRMRKHYKKHGIVLKYIYVCEYTDVAIHTHVIMTYIDTHLISKEWKQHGRAFFTSIYEEGGYAKLAEYIVKETKQRIKKDAATGKKWQGSRNLITIEPKKNVIPRTRWLETPRDKKGYYLDKESLRNGFHDITGYKFQSYTMIKIPEKKKRKIKRGRGG